MACNKPQAQQAMTVEAECLALKEFLSEVLTDRAALKTEFDQLSAKNQLIIEQMEDEEDSEEDDVSAEGRLLEYQSEKQRLDVKLRDLEEKLRVKDQQMAELDIKASEYLCRVTTSSNSIFDQEESETASVAAEETGVDNEFSGAPEDAVVTGILDQAPDNEDKQEKEPVQVGCATSEEKENEPRPVWEINEASAKTEDKKVESVENVSPPHEVVDQSDSVIQDGAAVKQNTSANLGVTVPSEDHILSLSSLVSELRRVKDEMGKCMSVKEKSFLDLEDELARSKRDQENLKKQISTMISKMDVKEKKFVNLIEENKKFKEELENKSKELETARSADIANEKEELENKLKVLELMMVEYRAEIEAVTGEKTQAEQQAKELVKEIASRSDVSSEKELELNPSEAELLDNSSSGERATPDISTGDNLDEITQDDTFEGYTLLEEENKKLSEKLRSTSRYLKALARDREDKRKECTVLQEKVQQVEGKMMQLQGTFDTLVSAVMSERDDLVKESDAKSAQIKTMGDKIDAMQLREKQLTQQLEVRSAEQEQLKINEELRKSYQEESCRQKNEYEKIIKELSADQQCVEQKHSEEILCLKNSNETYIAEVNKFKSEIKRLHDERTKADEAVNESLAQKLSDKVEECKTLEKKIETINNEMNEFVTCLKEEMARMKEDMAKQSDARLQLEVSYDTLTEEQRDIVMEKKRLEESSVELTIALGDQKALVEAMKEQINELSTKNNALSSELHDKDQEYNEELKAREATIQELKVTLTNNQKQSSENYRGLQDDVNTMQLKLAKQEEEYKSAIEQLEQRYSQLVEEKNELEQRMQETLENYQSDKMSFESTKKDLSLKINALESERALYQTKVKSSLQTLQPTTGNNVDEVGDIVESNDSSGAVAYENEVSDEDVADSTSSAFDKAEQIYPKDLIATWSGSLEELECKLTSAKDELVRVSQSALLTGAGGSAADYRTKIAAMVQHVEELSGVLAATRIRRGLPTKSSVISVTEGEAEALVVGSSAVQVKSDIVSTDEKSTATWIPFATQKEFEAFVAEKELQIAELEEKVSELERLLASKSKHISALEEQLEGVREEIIDLKSDKTFQDHLDDINRLNSDITKLKDELDQSHTECRGLKSTITELEKQKLENESDKLKVYEELESKLQNTLPRQSDDDSSESESEDLELKKNLDERLKLILSTIESRILASTSQVELEKIHLLKVVEIEKSYENSIRAVNDEYMIKIEELQKKLENCSVAHKVSCDAFQCEKKSLESKVKELQQEVNVLGMEKTKMDEKLKLTENKVGVLNEVKRKLVEYTRTLEEKIQSSDKQNNASVMEKELLKQTDSLTKENRSLQINIASLNEKIDSLLIELSQKRKVIADLEEKLSSVSESLVIAQKKYEIFELEHTNCFLLRENLEDNITTVQKENEELIAEVKNMKNKLQFCQEEKKHLEKTVDLLTKEKCAIENLKIELEETLVMKESNSIACNLKSEELLEINKALQGDIELLKCNVTDLEEHKKKLNSDILSLKCTIELFENGKDNNLRELEHKALLMQAAEIEKADLCKLYESQKKENETVCQENKSLTARVTSLEEENQVIQSLKDDISRLNSENKAVCKKYDEEQQNLLEMQNMMVSDLEKMILSLEAERNSLIDTRDNLTVQLKQLKEENSALENKVSDQNLSLKYLQEKVSVLESDKELISLENQQLRIVIDQTNLGTSDDGHNLSALRVTEQLMSQTKELRQKLESAEQSLKLKDSEHTERMQLEKGGQDLKLQALRKDMREELDILDSRKEEETDALVEKFERLEEEFTTSLAETRDYYESVLLEEKAEFGRVLVSKVAEYEKRLFEKNDEISGWEIKLMSMQEELDGKMIVIEELEERLNERSATPQQFGILATSPTLSEANRHLSPLQEVSETPTPSLTSPAPTNDRTAAALVYPTLSTCSSSHFTSSINTTEHEVCSSDQVLASGQNVIGGAPCTFTPLTYAPFTTINSSYSFESGLQSSVFPLSDFGDPYITPADASEFSSYVDPQDYSPLLVTHGTSTVCDPSFQPYDSFAMHDCNGRYDPSSRIDKKLHSKSADRRVHDKYEAGSSTFKGYPSKHNMCNETLSYSRPILSFVIPTTFSDHDSNVEEVLNSESSPRSPCTLKQSEPKGTNKEPLPVRRGMKTAVFVSREFPGDTSHSSSAVTDPNSSFGVDIPVATNYNTSSNTTHPYIADLPGSVANDEDVTDVLTSDVAAPTGFIDASSLTLGHSCTEANHVNISSFSSTTPSSTNDTAPSSSTDYPPSCSV